MKRLTCLAPMIGAFALTFSMSSCADDEETWKPQDANYWGYFDGEINGEKMHLQNTHYKDYSIHPIYPIFLDIKKALVDQ